MQRHERVLTTDMTYFKLALPDLILDNYYLAGGAVRDLSFFKEAKDYDIYAKDSLSLNILLHQLSRSPAFVLVQESSMANTYKHCLVEKPFQIIKILTGRGLEVVTQFDFDVNMKYISLCEEKFTYDKICGVTNVKDNPKIMKLGDNIKTPKTMLFRLQKMSEKGFSLEKNEFIKLLELVKEEVSKDSTFNLSEYFLKGMYDISPNNQENIDF